MNFIWHNSRMNSPAEKTDETVGRDAENANDTPTDSHGKVAPVEIGGRDGLEPTRYGDWEKAGRCIDF